MAEVLRAREGRVGTLSVRRALPQRARRTVGAWCFADHMGPVDPSARDGLEVAPHPHIGLQTVTWLVAGEMVHRDSLGTEQVIRPGQLNLMTAGGGVSHSEEGTRRRSETLEGVQLWVAQPEATRLDTATFEHYAELPRAELGAGVATVFVGTMAGATSPARRDSDHSGAELELFGGTAELPVEERWESGVLPVHGVISVEGQAVGPGQLAYLGVGRSAIALSSAGTARCLVLAGVPFDEPLLMWWNFVARTRAEIDAAWADWAASAQRFGRVASRLPRVEVGPPPWRGTAAAEGAGPLDTGGGRP